MPNGTLQLGAGIDEFDFVPSTILYAVIDFGSVLKCVGFVNLLLGNLLLENCKHRRNSLLIRHFSFELVKDRESHSYPLGTANSASSLPS